LTETSRSRTERPEDPGTSPQLSLGLPEPGPTATGPDPLAAAVVDPPPSSPPPAPLPPPTDRLLATNDPAEPPGSRRTSLLDVPSPSVPIARLPPEQLEPYILAGIHQDRTPGTVLVVLHPGKRYKLPEGLFEELATLGFTVVVEETRRDTMESVRGLRDRLQELSRQAKPLDVVVVGGDGTLDHHLLIAAYAAFYPELVTEVAGRIDVSRIDDARRRQIPEPYRSLFHLQEPIPPIPPTPANLQTIWILRGKLERLLRKQASLAKILRSTETTADSPLLRCALLATFFPAEVDLLPDRFDLAKLAEASQAETFRGLYPFVRAIVPYPAGTAADNAVFAGVPGWGYALAARSLDRFGWLRPLARKIARRARRAFVRYFTREGTVVPARLSMACIDGHWQRLCSHAIGGPASGQFFAGDLTSKASTLTGYLSRAPAMLWREAFGGTVVEAESRHVDGRRKSFVRGMLAEGLYTNRTFIGGVGAVPTTTPTSFGGESSLLVLPPLVARQPGQVTADINVRGVFSFLEAIVSGIIARGLHILGLNPRTLAGGGRMLFPMPEHQVAIQEGEEIRLKYYHPDGRPRAVPAQISGDPVQATELGVKVLWGPIPLLAARRSLLLESALRTLNDLRLQRSFRLDRTYIGGVHHFRHLTGIGDPEELTRLTGLVDAPLYLPSDLQQAQQRLLAEWQRLDTGEFADTSAPGLALLRRGLFCHNNDQTAHLLLFKESYDRLLVRQVRRRTPTGEVCETRSSYRWLWGGFALQHSQTTRRDPEGPIQLLGEEYLFRDSEEFAQLALTYFPLLSTRPEEPVLALDRELLPATAPIAGIDLTTEPARSTTLDDAEDDASPE
jgi:hypothetical protein